MKAARYQHDIGTTSIRKKSMLDDLGLKQMPKRTALPEARHLPQLTMSITYVEVRSTRFFPMSYARDSFVPISSSRSLHSHLLPNANTRHQSQPFH